MSAKTKRLTESAMLLAVAIVLELLSKLLIPEQAFGGQITVVSMLPVVLIGYRHGMKWGLLACFTYSLLEMALGAKTVASAFLPGFFGDGAMIGKAVVMCLLDYVVAYTVLFLGGAFRSRKRPGTGLMLGSILALSARYFTHIASGYILFSSWAEWYFTQEGFPAWGAVLVERLSPAGLSLLYSVVYNGMYMIPEIVFTAIASLLIARIPKTVIRVTAEKRPAPTIVEQTKGEA